MTTDFVMVPVPEEYAEHVQDLLEFKFRRATPRDWDPDAVGRLYRAAGEGERALLSFVADATLRSEVPTLADIARSAGRSEHEMLGVAMDLGSRSKREGGPHLLAVPRRPRGAGESRDDPWLIYMSKEIAELVTDAARRGEAGSV